MKKKIKIAFIILILIALVYEIFHPSIYQFNYYSSVGIDNKYMYEDIVKDLGEPQMVIKVDDDWQVNYDGFNIVFETPLHSSAFRRVEITGSQYRFGWWKIGVGTSRKKIESVYRHIKKAKDIPSDEIRIIDYNNWVLFYFDENDKVSKICITDDM